MTSKRLIFTALTAICLAGCQTTQPEQPQRPEKTQRSEQPEPNCVVTPYDLVDCGT